MSNRDAFERRLEELRRAAAETGHIDAVRVRASGAPVQMKDGVRRLTGGRR